jgi:hypothetical protein
MKKITAIIIIVFLFGCSPSQKAPVDEAQITALEQDYAVALWKASKAKTDECTSPFKWIAYTFIPDKNWSDCCWQHDFDYHYGYLYNISREQADYELWECVDSGGNPVVARVIYTGVKIGGGFYYENGE